MFKKKLSDTTKFWKCKGSLGSKYVKPPGFALTSLILRDVSLKAAIVHPANYRIHREEREEFQLNFSIGIANTLRSGLGLKALPKNNASTFDNK